MFAFHRVFGQGVCFPQGVWSGCVVRVFAFHRVCCQGVCLDLFSYRVVGYFLNIIVHFFTSFCAVILLRSFFDVTICYVVFAFLSRAKLCTWDKVTGLVRGKGIHRD